MITRFLNDAKVREHVIECGYCYDTVFDHAVEEEGDSS